MTPTKIENFDAVVSTFGQSPTGEIEISDLLSFLGNVHKDQAFFIHAARIPLTALLETYARYPFSRPIPLTRDALLRATLFLTERVNRMYRQAFPESRRRVDRDWLTVIFKALIPSAGVGMVDYDEVADFLCRCPFPLPALNTFSHENPENFREMARRLDATSIAAGVMAFKISVDTLQVIGRLAASLLGYELEDEVKSDFIPTTKMDILEFIDWGTQIQLLKAFDKLFDALLQPKQIIVHKGTYRSELCELHGCASKQFSCCPIK